MVAVAGLLCLLAVVSVREESAVTPNAPNVDDEVLLQSIHKGLSETLPTYLAPLTSAVSWERNPTAAMNMKR